MGDFSTLDHLCQAGRIDVVFDPYAMLLSVCVDESEPFLHSVEEFDRCTESLEVLAAELDAGLACLVEHQLHVA